MDEFTITAARHRTHCWCGADAAITRAGEGVESSYCMVHWMVWWENALIRPSSYPPKANATKQHTHPILVISEQVV